MASFMGESISVRLEADDSRGVVPTPGSDVAAPASADERD